jgi:hypothetical protein
MYQKQDVIDDNFSVPAKQQSYLQLQRSRTLYGLLGFK